MTYALIENGIVINVVVWDGNLATWTPPDGQTAIEVKDGDVPHIGLGYADGVYEQPPLPETIPPTPAEILSSNTSTRDTLLSQATSAIAPLQDAVDLDMATDADTAALKAWKTYRVLVNRVDLAQAYPAWPTAPSA
ncbi:tail fiber assembly protein [Burkholderia sp. PAMC 28687]|uniref:tail fiber assembly protein n=1 Tax=Burkholderia sp. PAMC 28687 TaxID=1795874 RepID=UPI0009EC27D1|nr:tail fiber assembly protein [Burkholderia sp. PAMC 28687]